MPNPDAESFVLRDATFADAREIYALIRENPETLIPRALTSIVENIDRFIVAADASGKIVGALSYVLWTEFGDPLKTTAELQSVCVSKAWRGRGIGRKLVEMQIERLDRLSVWQIVVLTFEVSFFGSLGFDHVDKREIMYKLYRGCINCSKHDDPFTCPEQAMVRKRAR